MTKGGRSSSVCRGGAGSEEMDAEQGSRGMSDNELSGVEGLYQFTAQNVSVPSNTFEWGASVLVTGQGQGDYFYQEASDFDDTVEDIPISLVVRPLAEKISHEEFWKIILEEKVPVTTSLVAVMGLPSSGKTSLLEKLFKKQIGLKSDAKLGIDYYLRRKQNKECLSIYELCALGSSRHRYAWSFATNRYGAIFSILCSLIRRNPYVRNIEFETTDEAPRSVIDAHVKWLMRKTQEQLNSIKNEPDKLTLIQDGLSFINVIDVGVNKSLYDFLSIMLLSCCRHIRLAFFSLDRDAPDLDKIPDLSHYAKRHDNNIVMRQRSRLTYLLHFATLGYTKKDEQHKEKAWNATVMIATKEKSTTDAASLEQAKADIIEQAKSQGVDQFLKTWFLIDSNDDESVMNFGKGVQDVIKDYYRERTISLPLRWIFLRSLVVSLNRKGEPKKMILRKSFILEGAKYLQMEPEDVEDFLKTFTDFGSILYMPRFDALKDIVIVNIWEFTQYLSKLFYPQEEEEHATNLQKYGIISIDSIKKIFHEHSGNEKDFMKVITTLAMASEIKSGQSILVNDKQLEPGLLYYYIPLAKIAKAYEPTSEEDDYAFIEIQSVNFPANVQACISHSILSNNEDAALVVAEHCDISRFRFKSQGDPPVDVEIEMIYKGSKTRLRIKNNSDDILAFSTAVEVCRKVLTASCQCLQSRTNTIRDLKYSVAVPCCSSSARNCHYLYYNLESQLCDACSAETSQNKFRLYWSEAAKKCELLKQDSKKRVEENIPLRFEEIASLVTDDCDLHAIAEALNIKPTEIPGLSSPYVEGKKKTMMLMLLMWERQTDRPTRHALIAALKNNKCNDIAKKLETPDRSIDAAKKCRGLKYTPDEIAEQNSPALTFEEIVKYGNTIKESDVQKLVTALKLGDYKVPEFSEKQKKITSILLKWEEVNKEMANKAALEKILDKYEIPYSFAQLKVEQKETSSEEVSTNSSLTGELTGETFEKERCEKLLKLTDNLEKLFLVQGKKSQKINWEKSGIRIGIEEDSLPSSETIEIATAAFVGGEFKFPKNTVLVSAVYAVTVSKCLLKPLRLDIQHCVDLTGRPGLSKYLKFAIAPVSTHSPPYQFRIIEEGEFSSNSQYGSIKRKEFCLVCILGLLGSIIATLTGIGGAGAGQVQQQDGEQQAEGVQQQQGGGERKVHEQEEQQLQIRTEILKKMKYNVLVYYEKKGVENLVTFTAAKDLDVLFQFIDQRHSSAKIGPHEKFRFGLDNEYIELKFDSPQEEPFTGWTIEPQTKPCRFYQDDVNSFGDIEYSRPSCCLVSVNGSHAVKSLHYSVPVVGVVRPVTLYICIPLRTTSPTNPSILASSSSKATAASSTGGASTVDKVKKVINNVLVSYHALLTDLPKEALPYLANQLYAVRLINNAVKDTPSLNKFITEFKASLSFKKKLPEIQELCQKFLNSFIAAGGSYAAAAIALHKDWVEAVTKVGLDFNILS